MPMQARHLSRFDLDLRRQLNVAIAQENFAVAAQLRDKVKVQIWSKGMHAPFHSMHERPQHA